MCFIMNLHIENYVNVMGNKFYGKNNLNTYVSNIPIGNEVGWGPNLTVFSPNM